MSESRPFEHRTRNDGPEEDRASTMATSVRNAFDLAGLEKPEPGRLALTSVGLKMLVRPEVHRNVYMSRLPNGLWQVSVDSDSRRLGLWEAWEYYLELLAEKEMDKAPADLQLRAMAELRFGGEVVQLEVRAYHRAMNMQPYARREELGSRMILWRTFGPPGHSGVGVRQDYNSACRQKFGRTTSDGGSISSYSYWQVSRHRNKGTRIQGVPEVWAAELDQQFNNRIPIKALTPNEWRLVIGAPFTEADAMTEQS